jgi:hypothetical protein
MEDESMTKIEKKDYEGPLYAPHPDLTKEKVECFIDEDKVDCETWGEIESEMDFLGMIDE